MSLLCPTSLQGFAAAAAFASDLAAELDHCHAAVLTDDDGLVLDVAAFAGRHDTADSAIRHAAAAVAVHTAARRVVLVSVLADVDLSLLSVVDIHAWSSAHRRLSAVGLTLSEWVLHSGRHFRSLAASAAREGDAAAEAA